MESNTFAENVRNTMATEKKWSLLIILDQNGKYHSFILWAFKRYEGDSCFAMFVVHKRIRTNNKNIIHFRWPSWLFGLSKLRCFVWKCQCGIYKQSNRIVCTRKGWRERKVGSFERIHFSIKEQILHWFSKVNDNTHIPLVNFEYILVFLSIYVLCIRN